MSVSRALLERLAAETRFPARTLERVIRLGELVTDIGRHPLLTDALALKGGTALNLFFGEPTRLSVDLDFNYVANADRARMLSDRAEIERALERIATVRRYRVQRSRDEHAGRKLFLTYASNLGGHQRLEIDLNFLFRVSLEPPVRRAMWQPGDLVQPEIAVVANAELSIGKLLALLDRGLPRDAYDTARLPEIAAETWCTKRFRRLFTALAATLPRPLNEYGLERLSRITDTLVREQLAEMLTIDERLDAADLRQRAWGAIEPLLELDEAELDFTRGVSRRELLVELLFPDDGALASLLLHHPALTWKIENVRRHRRHRS